MSPPLARQLTQNRENDSYKRSAEPVIVIDLSLEDDDEEEEAEKQGGAEVVVLDMRGGSTDADHNNNSNCNNSSTNNYNSSNNSNNNNNNVNNNNNNNNSFSNNTSNNNTVNDVLSISPSLIMDTVTNVDATATVTNVDATATVTNVDATATVTNVDTTDSTVTTRLPKDTETEMETDHMIELEDALHMELLLRQKPPADRHDHIHIHRIDFTRDIHNHCHHFFRDIIPRLRQFVQAVYKMRQDDMLRYRWLLGTDEVKTDILLELCPFLDVSNLNNSRK
jgi:hypothetical protein